MPRPLPWLVCLLTLPALAGEPTQPFPPDQPRPPKPAPRPLPQPARQVEVRRLPANLAVLSVDMLTADWPVASRDAALHTLARYGIPDEMTETALTWHDNGGWKRTIVHRSGHEHLFPKPHTDVLEQVVAYAVPVDRYDDLARYNGSVHADRTAGELSVRCDDEIANVLLLNLAVRVVDGDLSPDAARRRVSEAVMEWLIGTLPDEMRGLAFSQDAHETPDVDQTAIPWTYLRDHPAPAPRRPGT